jgi:hypothetical protein
VSGLRLAELPASEMLDVLHYFFEEDYMFTSEEQSVYKQRFRKHTYETLYGISYAFYDESYDKSQELESAIDDSENEPEEVINPFNPRAKKETKAFIEPTLPVENSNKPFGDILDMPLG